VSFGTIRTWGSVGFATSALVVGELLSIIGIQYMVWPYIGLGTVVLIVIFRLQDVKVDSEPIKLQDVKQLIRNKQFLIFLLLLMFLTIGHLANDSFIGLYITEHCAIEILVGLSWCICVVSEEIVLDLAGK